MNLHIRLLGTVALSLAALGSGGAWGVAVGEQPPAFALPDARGEIVTLSQFRGQVTYVDFWASWCGPCKRSFPWMNALQRRYGEHGLVIVAVNVDKKRADAERFLQQIPANFRVVFDAAGVTPLAWAVGAMPSSYLIDGEGKVTAVETGFFDERKGLVEEHIRSLLRVP